MFFFPRHTRIGIIVAGCRSASPCPKRLDIFANPPCSRHKWKLPHALVDSSPVLASAAQYESRLLWPSSFVEGPWNSAGDMKQRRLPHGPAALIAQCDTILWTLISGIRDGNCCSCKFLKKVEDWSIKLTVVDGTGSRQQTASDTTNLQGQLHRLSTFSQ